MAIDNEIIQNIVGGLDNLPHKSEIDTPTNNIDLDATEEESGLMSADDKKKLNKIDEEANHYVLPVASTTLGGVKTTSDIIDISEYLPTPIVEGIPYYKPYTLPIATSTTLGGIKTGTGVDISEDGTLTIKSVNSDNFDGVLAIEKGGTGASTTEGARKALNILPTVTVGNLNYGTTVSGNAYFHALTLKNVASNNISMLKLAIFTSTVSFVLDISITVGASTKSDPVISVDVPITEAVFSIISQLYIAMNSSTASGNIELYYKNNSVHCKITVLQASNGYITKSDGYDCVSLAASPNGAVDVIGETLNNVFKLSDVSCISFLATETREGYLSAEDKTKIDQLSSQISTAITNLSNTLTPKINNAYSSITLASPKTDQDDQTDYSDLITSTVYTFRKGDDSTDQIELPNTIRSYKMASSANNGLMSKEHFDYIESLPDILSNMNSIIGSEKCLPLSGGAMTGNISYTGSNGTQSMIRWIDNTDNSTGYGIAIGGGGPTIIGGGESSSCITSSLNTYGGVERMVVCNDGAIEFYSNCEDGFGSAKLYEMGDGTIKSESFNATNSYKLNDKVAIQYNSTDDCIDFVFA